MTSTLNKYWQLFWSFRKIALSKFFAYRGDFFFWLTVSMMWTTFNFFFFSLIINVTNTIGGWSRWELYALLSIFTMLDAFTWSFLARNMWAYTNSIFKGELSQLLIKPVDAQFMIMTSENNYNNVPRFMVGVVMLIVSLGKLHIKPSLGEVFLFMVIFMTSLMLIYSLWFLVATLAFWVDKLNNINDIVPGLRRVWQLPRQVYAGVSSVLLTVVLPLGLVTSVPSEILLGRSSGLLVGYLILFTLILFIISRWFFNYSSRKYSSVGN